jgi:galactonate dehydratase
VPRPSTSHSGTSSSTSRASRSGPVQAGVHLCAASPNALVQEVVRAFYFGWYLELVTELPGYIAPLEGPGVGLKLRPEVWDRPDAVIRVSEWRP